MHELSIAMSIAEIALKEAHDAAEVTELELALGKWCGVDAEALMFSLEAVLAATPKLENCKIILHKCEPIMHCKSCNRDFTPVVQYITECEYCKSNNIMLIAGRELAVKSVELRTHSFFTTI